MNKHTLLTEVMFNSLLDLIVPHAQDYPTSFSPPETFTRESGAITSSHKRPVTPTLENASAKASFVALSPSSVESDLPTFIPNALVVTSAAAVLESIGTFGNVYCYLFNLVK